MLNKTSVTARNISTLNSLTLRNLEGTQVNHPDHRFLSDKNMPFPCPVNVSNGIMANYTDIEFRNTKPGDLPKGMVRPKKHNYPKTRKSAPLGRSKWDFAYMASGASLAIRINTPRPTQDKPDNGEYLREYRRIRNLGKTVVRYQKSRGYLTEGFEVQTSEENIIIGKLANGTEIVAPHIVFWRVDGTKLDPALVN